MRTGIRRASPVRAAVTWNPAGNHVSYVPEVEEVAVDEQTVAQRARR
jgi:hypothetical protein